MPQALDARDASGQLSFRERLLSNTESKWPPSRDNYYAGSGIKLFILDDTQLECGSLHNSGSEKSASYLHEADPVPEHWSGSSSESISSSHTYLSSLPEDSSVDAYFIGHKRSSKVDDVLLDYHKGADKLSALLARLGLQDNSQRPHTRNGSSGRPSSQDNSGLAPSRSQSDAYRGNRRYNQRRRVDHQHTDNDDNSSEIEERRSGTSPQDGGALVFYLACPYVKHDPEEHVRCNFRELKSISILKQHLGREHKLGRIYCTTCLEHFNKDSELQAHVRENTCEHKTEDEHHSKYQQIKKRQREQGHEAVWYSIYEIIFPGEVQPASPYAGDESRKHLMCLFESLGMEHTKQLMRNLKSQRRHTIASEAAFQRRSTRWITAVADSLYGEFEVDGATTTGGNNLQDSAPAMRETTIYDDIEDVYNLNAFANSSDPISSHTRPQTSTSTASPTLRRTTAPLANHIPVLEDEDEVADTFPQMLLNSARDIDGAHAQRRMNEIYNETYSYRHSNPDPPAEPWVVPQSRPITNPEGMEQINMQQILNNDTLVIPQENQLYNIVGIDSAHADWSAPRHPSLRRRGTRGGLNNRLLQTYNYSDSTQYGHFQWNHRETS